MAMRRMMQEVPKADVVVTNPTHFAVALKYETGMEAPVVLAKGADFIAQRIKEIAKEKRCGDRRKQTIGSGIVQNGRNRRDHSA